MTKRIIPCQPLPTKLGFFFKGQVGAHSFLPSPQCCKTPTASSFSIRSMLASSHFPNMDLFQCSESYPFNGVRKAPPRLLSQDSFCSARCTHHRAPRLLIHFKQTYCPFLKHLRLRLARSLPQIIDSTTVLGGETKQGGYCSSCRGGEVFCLGRY